MSLEWKTVEVKSIVNIPMSQSPKSKFYNENVEGMPFLQGNKTFEDTLSEDYEGQQKILSILKNIDKIKLKCVMN